jgi:acyl-CoA synthetase (AMP-forming)/AMP-acid ligase II
MCSNRPEFLEIYLGCAWMGAVTVPINTALRGIQLSHILRNATPKLLVIESAFMQAIETLESGVALPDIIWTIGEDAAVPPAASGSVSPLPPLGEGVSPAPVQPDDTVAILYTSGTTGPSKGVCCPQAQMFWWGVYSARALDIRQGDVLFTTLPLFHTNALNAFYQALLNGCTYALEPKFSASGFWVAARRHRATVGYLLGAMAVMLLVNFTARFSNVLVCRCSTATARPKRISCSQAPSRPIAPARWAISSRAWRRASSVRTMRLSPTERPANCCYARASRLHSRRVISECRTRRPKRGEISGFTPATASCATRTAIIASSTG